MAITRTEAHTYIDAFDGPFHDGPFHDGRLNARRITTRFGDISMKATLLAGLLPVALAVMTSAASAQTILRMSYQTPQTDTQHQGALKFAELVKSRTQGKLQVKLFADGTLGNDQASISATRGGTIDIVLSGSSTFSGMVPMINIIDIPFLFKGPEHAYTVLDGEVGTGLLASLAKHNLAGLAYWENGFRSITNAKRPVRGPADVKGLKIRTTSNPVHMEAFRLLGANPIAMPLPELYTALETNAVDAQEHPINVTWSARLYEVQKYLSDTRHAYSPLIMAMTKKKFDALPAEQRKVLVDSAREAGQYQRKLVNDNNRAILDKLRQAKVEVVEKVDMQPFRDVVEAPVRKTFIEKNAGAEELLKAIDEAGKAF
ncbi:MAG: TRAP transporter substrate-binding protein [Rhodocyclaceae bacterium]